MDDGDSSTSRGSLPSEPEPEPDPAARLVVDVIHDDGDWSAFPDLEQAVRIAGALVSDAPELSFGVGEAAIVLASDAMVRELNRTFRQQDKPTNVLSFPAPPPPAGVAVDRVALGDVVLAAETVRREAEELGIPPKHHLQHLVVHGLLHLIGYDHLNDDEAAEMESIETRLLSRIGIADPYAEPAH